MQPERLKRPRRYSQSGLRSMRLTCGSLVMVASYSCFRIRLSASGSTKP